MDGETKTRLPRPPFCQRNVMLAHPSCPAPPLMRHNACLGSSFQVTSTRLQPFSANPSHFTAAEVRRGAPDGRGEERREQENPGVGGCIYRFNVAATSMRLLRLLLFFSLQHGDLSDHCPRPLRRFPGGKPSALHGVATNRDQCRALLLLPYIRPHKLNPAAGPHGVDVWADARKAMCGCDRIHPCRPLLPFIRPLTNWRLVLTPSPLPSFLALPPKHHPVLPPTRCQHKRAVAGDGRTAYCVGRIGGPPLLLEPRPSQAVHVQTRGE